ncbi:unnamed protein product [Cunninghamella echinulata]
MIKNLVNIFPINESFISNYHEIETDCQYKNELEYIAEVSLNFDVGDFEDNIHTETYKRDLNNKNSSTKSKKENFEPLSLLKTFFYWTKVYIETHFKTNSWRYY